MFIVTSFIAYFVKTFWCQLPEDGEIIATKHAGATLLQQNQLDVPISKMYSSNEILHVSDSSSVHHQQFFTEHTAMVYVIHVC